MSALTARRLLPQIFCAITRTNGRTHDIIRSGLDRSPLFSGAIEGRGPDRKSVVEVKRVSVRVDLGGRRIINNKVFFPTSSLLLCISFSSILHCHVFSISYLHFFII